LVWLIYAGAVGWLGFGGSWWLFIIGLVLSLLLELIDGIIAAWWLFPFEQQSIQIQYWMRRRDWRAAGGLLFRRFRDKKKLLLFSAGFAMVWWLLALYVITSTGSVVAVGMVMGLGYWLTMAIIGDWKRPDLLGDWFGWQIKRPLQVTEVRVVAGGFVVVWSLLQVWLMQASLGAGL